MDDQATLRTDFINALNNQGSGTYKASGDIIDFTLWDSFTLASTVLSHNLFTSGVGTTLGGVVRTLADTNLIGSNGMPNGWKLFVKALKVFYTADEVRTDVELVTGIFKLMRQTVASIKVTGKDNLGQFSLSELFNVPMGISVTSAAGLSVMSQGKGFGIMPLNLPLVLASNVRFNVEIQHTVAPIVGLDGDKITLGLNGILQRLS